MNAINNISKYTYLINIVFLFKIIIVFIKITNYLMKIELFFLSFFNVPNRYSMYSFQSSLERGGNWSIFGIFQNEHWILIKKSFNKNYYSFKLKTLNVNIGLFWYIVNCNHKINVILLMCMSIYFLYKIQRCSLDMILYIFLFP